ncbi:MAG: hypothetical protein ACR2PQ_11905 [Myxococcota bacterium]
MKPFSRLHLLSLLVLALAGSPGLALPAAEGACVSEGSRKTASLSRAVGKEQLRCLKRFAAGKEEDLDACRFLDARGKLERAREKLAKGEAKKCAALPAFGFAGTEAAADAATGASWGLVGDVLAATADEEPRCQQDLVKQTHALFDTVWKEAAKLGKRAIGPASTAADFETSLNTDLAASSKLAKRSAALAKKAARSCSEGTSLAAFGDRAARCAACRAVNRAGALELDCDALDDADSNFSCAWKRPPTLTLEEEPANEARGIVGRAGGSLVATAADGTIYTLDVPEGALTEDVEITVVPVASVPDFPLDAPVLGGAQLEPDGLTFTAGAPATLTVELPAAPVQPLGFGWEGAGEQLHLRLQEVDGATLRFDVLHFSGVGAAEGDGADVSEAGAWDASAIEPQAATQLAPLLPGIGPTPNFTDPAFVADALAMLESWYSFGVLPRVTIGADAGAFYLYGAQEAMAWLQVQTLLGLLTTDQGLFGAPSDPLADKNELVRNRLIDGFVAEVERIVVRCEVTEDALTFVQEAIAHGAINAALQLVAPPPGANPNAFLPFFEGRCIRPVVAAVEGPESLEVGESDILEIRAGWEGPSGALSFANPAVEVRIGVSGGDVSLDSGLVSSADGNFTTGVTLTSESGASVTVTPAIEFGVFEGGPFVFEIPFDDGDDDPDPDPDPIDPCDEIIFQQNLRIPRGCPFD